MNRTATSASHPIVKRQVISYLLALLPAIIVATVLYADGLFHDKSQLHGDSILHGLSVLSFQASVLKGDQDMLWTDEIYMGHPVHAEGQFAFFSPLTNFVSLLFVPATAMNVLHWLSLILTAAGMLALCRQLGLSFAASSLGAVLVTFSGFWVHSQHNVTIAATLAWLPWILWGFEKWIRNPANIAPLVIFTSITIFSGYPQFLHGAVAYVAVLFIVALITPSTRSTLVRQFPRYLACGALVILLCVGITAVQLLPLIELTGLSHRESGIDLAMMLQPSLLLFLRGIPFYGQGSWLAYVDFLGSPTACLLLSGLLLVKCEARILRHAIAAFVLANLAVGQESPLFNVIYNYHLLPGLQYFRLFTSYLALTVIGIAVVAAYMADRLANATTPRLTFLLTLSIVTLLWLWIFRRLQLDAFSSAHYWLLIATAGVVLLALSDTWKRFCPHLLTVIVVCEIASLKTDAFIFYPNALLKEPDTVAFMKRDPNFQDYKTYDAARIGRFALVPASEKETVEKFAVGLLSHVTPSSNLLWNLPNISGAHALPLKRSMMLQKVIKGEIAAGLPGENVDAPPDGRAGTRIIDYFGVKYIAADMPPLGESIVLRFTSQATGTRVYENEYALPRYQAYTAFEFAESADDALARIQARQEPRLIVEADAGEIDAAVSNAATAQNDAQAITFSAVRSTATEHLLSVDATRPGWLFIADANYPGWKATVDDDEVPVFTAQVLGKAVWIPEGRHQVRIWFDSFSYKLGLAITLLSCVIAIVAFAMLNRRTRSAYAANTPSAPGVLTDTR